MLVLVGDKLADLLSFSPETPDFIRGRLYKKQM
jgi:hypothetical protein